MENPAWELSKLLGEWRKTTPSQAYATVRGIAASSTATQWRSQLRAAELLLQVDRFLDILKARGDSVLHYERRFPAWAQAVFAPDVQWNVAGSGSKVIIAQEAIDSLSAFGDLMEATGISVAISDEVRETSLGALDEIIESLRDPELGLTPNQKAYLFELVSEVRRAFDEARTLGGFDVLRRVHELFAALSLVAESLDEEESTRGAAKRLRKIARRVVPYARFTAKAAGGGLAAAADIAQIGGSLAG